MSITKYHARWLSLVEISGPFLSLPVLARVFPQGLDAHDPDHFRVMRQVHEEWEENENSARPDRAIHTQWIRWVLTNTLDYGDAVVDGPAIPTTIKTEILEPQHRETLRPDMALMGPDGKAQLLIQFYESGQKLTKPVTGRAWKASPDTRMTQLLHDTSIPLGLITNGEHWMFVYAPVNETSGYASWYSTLWLEEPDTLAAFRTLLGMHRFFGVADQETLLPLLKESASQQQEVTDRLGYQVRCAVEILIQSLDRSDQEFGRELLQNVPETALYEASLTVMMRLVFLFCAEERELLLLGDELYDQNYAVSTLVAQLQDTADQHGEEILERRLDAWNRLLSTFRAVYGGVTHDRMRLPAYGGGLFNPDKFPFLEGRKAGTTWTDTPANPLPINNRTVLHLLRSLQFLELHGEAQRLSFRALGIEQIGHVYEGLLDHTAKRATEPIVGLVGKKEPELALSELEAERTKGDDKFFAYLKDKTGSTRRWANAIDQELSREATNRLRTVCGNDDTLFERVSPIAGLIRNDSFDRPVVVRTGSVYVTQGTDRRSSGTHYTPTSLTEPTVRYALEPLVYEGPAEGKDRADWKLKSAKELLELKICDMACGSGAFLVQAARYMSERIIESWDIVRGESANMINVTPVGAPATGNLNEQLIPEDAAERQTFAMRILAQRCLYGVDVNPLAVEMAKLSLWLLTLAKDKPFEFLDHSIRCGDSLVGLHDIRQLKQFSLKPDDINEPAFSGQWLEGVDQAINLRMKLEEMPANDMRDIDAQTHLLEEAEEGIARLRLAADLLVAAEFWSESRNEAQERTRHLANISGHFVINGPTDEFQQKACSERRGQSMFHWPLEFPEVMIKNRGFDAFIGNPPFITGTSISTILGLTYRNHIKFCWPHFQGRADICVAFILRATSLLRFHATIGFIATDSISEGDSRLSGTAFLLQHGFAIYHAIKRRDWPGIASVKVCHLHLYNGNWSGRYLLDGKVVPTIDSTFDGTIQLAEPHALLHSKAMSFTGTKVYGNGFVLDPSEARAILSTNTKYAEVVRPYLVGREINEVKCEPGRYIIDFTDKPKDVAMTFELAWKIVEERVLPDRLNAPEKSMREKFWQFQRPRKELYAVLKKNQMAWLIAATSDTVAFVSIPYTTANPVIFSHAVNVLALNGMGQFAVVQSSIHLAWARRYGSSMKGDMRYTTTDCFETFPFPHDTSDLVELGHRYNEMRTQISTNENIGFTTFYQRVHDPQECSTIFDNFRKVLVNLDQAVMHSYGWTDLSTSHDYYVTPQGIRFTIDDNSRIEILKRLLNLNLQRYEEELANQKKEGQLVNKGTSGRAARKSSSATASFLDDDASK